MSAIQNKARLPYEILRKIFKYIDAEDDSPWGAAYIASILTGINKKETFKTCLLVCKSWNFVAREFISGGDVLVVLNREKLPKLLDDIPLFGHTITSIELNLSKVYYININAKAVWKGILLGCPNLVSLHFSKINCGCFRYLKKLLDSDIHLENIQKIYVTNSRMEGLKIENIFLMVQLRFCATITELTIKNLKRNSVIEKYDGLISFISQFRHLVSLEVSGSYTQPPERIVDLKHLIHVAPKLKVLSLLGVPKITAKFENIHIDTFKAGKHLITLKIGSKNMNIRTVEYITTDLVGKITSLQLETKKLESDSTRSEHESKKILNDFKTCITGIKSVRIRYTYKNDSYFLNPGTALDAFTSEFSDDYDSYDSDTYSDSDGTDSDNSLFYDEFLYGCY